MISISGVWYDGRTSAQIRAVCRIYDSGGICVEGLEDGRKLLALSKFDAKVSPRLADTPRYIYFPGGEKFETGENDMVDRLVVSFTHPSPMHFVYRLEKKWRYTLLACAVLLLFLFGSVKYGIPFLAKAVAFRLPPATLRLASLQTLDILDRAFLHPSEIEIDRQTQLIEYFGPVFRKHTDHKPTVLFRKGGRIGPNAFALPNGTIVFTDEMVLLAEDDDELVAVLTHELGHVVHRHGMRSLIQDSILGFTLLALTGDVSGSSELFLGLPVVLTELAYSREFEREADQYALHYLRENHISPRHFVTLMGKIEKSVAKEKKTSGKDWLSYLSSHPRTQERIQRFE